MKKKELNILRKKKPEELKNLVAEKKKELVLTQAKIKAGQEKNVRKARNLRRDIAQILTIIHERELQDSLIIHERELQDSLVKEDKKTKKESKAKP